MNLLQSEFAEMHYQWFQWRISELRGQMNTTKTLFMFLEYFDTIDRGSLKFNETMGFSTWFQIFFFTHNHIFISSLMTQ